MITAANGQQVQLNPGQTVGYEEPPIRVETTVYGTPSKGNPNEFDDFTVETKMWLPNGQVYTNSQPMQGQANPQPGPVQNPSVNPSLQNPQYRVTQNPTPVADSVRVSQNYGQAPIESRLGSNPQSYRQINLAPTNQEVAVNNPVQAQPQLVQTPTPVEPQLSFQKPGVVNNGHPNTSYYSPTRQVRNFNLEAKQIPSINEPANYMSPQRTTLVNSRVVDPPRETVVAQPNQIQHSTTPQQQVISIPGEGGYSYQFPTYDPHRVVRYQHAEDAYQPVMAQTPSYLSPSRRVGNTQMTPQANYVASNYVPLIDSQGYSTIPVENSMPLYMSPARDQRQLYQITDAPTYSRVQQNPPQQVQVTSPSRNAPVYSNPQANQGQFYVETTTKVFF